MSKEELRSQLVALLVVFFGLAGFFAVLGFFGVLPWSFSLMMVLTFMICNLAVTLIYRAKVAEEFGALGGRMIYIYLFMRMYFLAGLTPADAIRKIAEHLDLEVLRRIYKYMIVGHSFTEASNRVFGDYRGEPRMLFENLMNSGVFGVGGLQYMKDATNTLLHELDKKVEKVSVEILNGVQMLAVLGTFAPLTIAVIGAALMGLGVFGIFNPVFMALLCLGISGLAFSYGIYYAMSKSSEVIS